MPFGELEVYVEGALGIKDTGIFGKSSPYCVLTCSAQQCKTPIAQDGSSNPYWNTTFMFKIDRSCQEIGIKIYCHNTLSADDELAYTSLSFKKIFFEGHSVPLQSFNVLHPSGRVGGQIRMSLTFFSDTLKHRQGQCSNPEPTHQRTVSEQCTSEYTLEASLRQVGGQAAAARPDYRSDGGYSSPGSIRSPAPGRPNQGHFHPNQQQTSFEDPQGPRQSYDDYCPPPNIQARLKDQRSMQQYDLRVQAATSHHTVDQNTTTPGRIPRRRSDPASRPVIPQPKGHRSAEQHIDSTAAETTQHTRRRSAKGYQSPANSTKSTLPTGSHSEERHNDHVLAGTPRSRPSTHLPEREQYGATATNSVVTPSPISSGPDRNQLPDLPQLQVHAPPGHEEVPGIELRSGLASPVVQIMAQAGSLPVGVQPKVSPDQNISSSSREMDSEGPLYQPRRFANRQQPQPPPVPKSKDDDGSDSDSSAKSKKSKSSPKSAKLEKSQKAQARLTQAQDQARPQGGLPKIQYPVGVRQRVPLDEATSSSREMDNKGPVYRSGRFANKQQQPPLPDHPKSQAPGLDSDKTAHSKKSKSSDKSAKSDSRRSQASATPNVANEIQPAQGAPTLQPKEKLPETSAEALEAPTHQSPRLRASSFESGQSSQLPTAPCEEPFTRHHPHVGPTGSDSDVKPQGSASSKECKISQASSAQAITSAKLSSQYVPALQPPAGTLGQSNQSTSVSQHGRRSPHPPGIKRSHSEGNSDGSKNSKASYTSAASQSSKASNASAHSNCSNSVLQSAPAKNPASNSEGSSLHRSVPLGECSMPNSDVSVHKSLSISSEAGNDGGRSGPKENLGWIHVSASEDGDLGTKIGVDKDPRASEFEDCHVKDEIGRFDQGGDEAGCSESGDAQITGGTRTAQQDDNGEQDETTDIANKNYYSHPVHKYDAKEYEHEELDLNQQYKGELEKSRIYKQEEEVDNNDHEQEDEDYENYGQEEETHAAEEQDKYYENYEREPETHAEEQDHEEESEGYASGMVAVEGHFRALGSYPPHKQDHVDDYANYEHEQDNSAEEQEQEEYEEESDGYAYTSEVVVPIGGDSGALGDHPPSRVSSRAKMRQAQNPYFQLDSFSGQSTGLHGSSRTRVQSNSPQVPLGRMSRGQDQQFRSYPAENSRPHYKPRQTVSHQGFCNNKHQERIFSKYEEVHRWLENSSTAGSPPDSPDRSEDVMPPMQDHIHRRQPPQNPHPRLQRTVTFHHPVAPDSPNRSEDLMPPTQDHIHPRQHAHNPPPRLQRPITFHHPGTPDQVRQYNRQVPDPQQTMMPSEPYGAPAVEKPPTVIRMGEGKKRNSGLNAILKGAIKLGKVSLPFLGDVAEAVVVQEITGQQVIIGERKRGQGQYVQRGQHVSTTGPGHYLQGEQAQQMHSRFVQGRPR